MEEIKKVDDNGTIRYYNEEGQLHRDGDKPAVIWEDGSKAYYVNGTCHRDGDKPAIIESDGTKKYYKNGELHRDGDEPAIIWSDGTKMWFWNGKHHRDGDKPAIIYSDGTKVYYVKGKLHRDGDKPALIIPRGTKKYYKNGELHRDGDKPAVIWKYGTQEYWVNGVRQDNKPNKMKEIKKVDGDGTTCYYNEKGLFHREGDKPAVIYSDGTKKYYKNGELHRDGDEPAVIWRDGYKGYYVNGKRHRDGDKPAVIDSDGSKQYWVNGVRQDNINGVQQDNNPNKITDLSWAKWSVEDIQENLPSGHLDVDPTNLLYQFFKENNESLVQHINFEMKEWLKDKVTSVLSQEQKALKVLNKKGFSAWLSNNKVSVLAWDSTGKDNMNMLIDEEEVNKLAQEYDVLNNPKG